MKYIYLVEAAAPWEPNETIGVFTSLRLAAKAANTQLAMSSNDDKYRSGTLVVTRHIANLEDPLQKEKVVVIYKKREKSVDK